ncbi:MULTISPECIES: C45 family peptidase [unclassified Mycolicibacterium]|uniref:C45 family autoproteolytic acyltransferase/hydolase n=1 Tax=unclassified Mycolicibacterium TaxID=2636767 RepID=UPI001EE4B2A3|nr:MULTISPECIES: C45 family peptidase [unclassified Mycolicibacterium]
MTASVTRTFQSTETEPYARGAELGRAHAADISRTVEHYRQLFASRGITDTDLAAYSGEALSVIESWSPSIAAEITGIAEGAALAVADIAMINARTEILARAGVRTAPECSTVVQLCDGHVIAQQNWDWYTIFEQDWFVWKFTTESGLAVETMTEFGVVAKAGCNSAGIGVLFNILHHDDDGQSMGVPVHVISRRVLAEATGVAESLSFIASARRSASTTMTIAFGGGPEVSAVCVETAPGDLGYVFADDQGLLVHTNHFLTAPLHHGDREHREYPDTVLRYDAIRRRLRKSLPATAAAIEESLGDTTGGPLAVCCRPDPSQPTDFQYQTLAHLALDLANGRVAVTPYGPPSSRS